ncbi:hypothetical protein P5G86_02175 [Paenibacillus jamilae]|uniref:Uncharacterized protein n=1 Tax=Bacillus thuringiensis serovar subtoxicus TaxID=475791 RepID=A0A9X6FE09_BACTU|nr:hypothetical protein [Bacillus thuringiensis]MEB4838907.1 hypothetical protein [Paenibacillus jamilae]MEB8578810.1 hypothetical protein [Bacillus cereus]MCR6855381.1 hypothetical protein [Bacillus thuringiensis]MDR4283098.1 hypothetical protein [Bacillus thuringiensis]MEB8592222.1 hypothetical protein [Bacillus cereus]
MSEDTVSLIMLAVLTIALVFVGVSSKFDSIIVDIIAVLFLLISTAIGAAILTERRRKRRKNTR